MPISKLNILLHGTVAIVNPFARSLALPEAHFKLTDNNSMILGSRKCNEPQCSLKSFSLPPDEDEVDLTLVQSAI
jgi:hypothetical protein